MTATKLLLRTLTWPVRYPMRHLGRAWAAADARAAGFYAEMRQGKP